MCPLILYIKRDTLSGNTAAGRCGSCEHYTPTLRLALWHAWRSQVGADIGTSGHRMSIPIT